MCVGQARRTNLFARRASEKVVRHIIYRDLKVMGHNQEVAVPISWEMNVGPWTVQAVYDAKPTYIALTSGLI